MGEKCQCCQRYVNQLHYFGGRELCTRCWAVAILDWEPDPATARGEVALKGIIALREKILSRVGAFLADRKDK